MLLQYRFQAQGAAAQLPETAAYPLYAALLKQAPLVGAKKIHGKQTAQVSQYFRDGCWHVSLLGRQAAEALAPTLDGLSGLELRRERLFAQLRLIGCRTLTADELLRTEPCGTMLLRLRTPTAFKSGGFYRLLPTQRLLLQSAMLKWNVCFPDYVIEDEDEGLEALASGLIYRHVSLESRDFRLKGMAIPGAVGELTVENRLDGFHRILANALLHFADCSGFGIKTALGMGGTTVLPTVL